MCSLAKSFYGEIPEGNMFAGFDPLDGVVCWPHGESCGYVGIGVKGDGLEGG